MGTNLYACYYDDKYSKPVEIFRGEGAVNPYMKRMLEEVNYCKKVKSEHFNHDMVLTTADKEDFKNASKYHICDEEYTVGDVRVRDHCHAPGKYTLKNGVLIYTPYRVVKTHLELATTHLLYKNTRCV